MARKIDKELLLAWRKHCESVQTATDFRPSETLEERRRRIRQLLGDYAAFVRYYFPHYTWDPERERHVASAPFHVKAAHAILKDRNLKAAWIWHRAGAKSVNLGIMTPMWLMAQSWLPEKHTREVNVMVLVGKSEESAKTLLGDLQAELQYNQRYIEDFGVQYNQGSWEDGNFVTAQGVAFFARGRGQSPRGLRHRNARPDYILMDDLDDDELVLNPSRVDKMVRWVKEALFGALDGGRGRFMMVGNLIGKHSILSCFAESPTVHVSQVNVYDAKGNISWADKWTREEIQAMEAFMGYRSFMREMMNNPITDGAIFRRDWIRWTKSLPLHKYDDVVLYIDPSFKSTTNNDYKAAMMWGRRGTSLHKLRAFLRQCTVLELVRWCYDLYEEMRREGCAVKFYMEANFMQDILLDEFRVEGDARGYQLPITGDKRKKPDKAQRIEQVSPLWERGVVSYAQEQQDDPDMQRSIEQTLAFERGSRVHDDGPDADEGAIYKLQGASRSARFLPIFGGGGRKNRLTL